jgi:hypothetical protein
MMGSAKARSMWVYLAIGVAVLALANIVVLVLAEMRVRSHQKDENH